MNAAQSHPGTDAGRSHEGHVLAQFGPQAAAYVASAVHARGPDLEALAARLQDERPGRLLDLGCGGGHVSFTAAPFTGEVVAYDLSRQMLAAVGAEADRRGLANIVTAEGVAEALPFPDAAFDAVASRYSAHHWRDLKAGLGEARRVLKAGGRAVFMDVVAPAWPVADTFLQAIELLRDPSHGRDFSRAEWEAHLSAAGFVVEAATPQRLRLEFSSWVARIRTPELNVAAIRALEQSASADVARHFEIEPDGTFTLDTLTLVARAA
ncbi:methyltransferase domain-containing protein [Xanthobacter sp. V4C-4]|uniref:class I SAM-dependent methyltransferase n=1 Tax=Xanthobacter cornucopiae TaxID=3119924 RepID=UPI003729978D